MGHEDVQPLDGGPIGNEATQPVDAAQVKKNGGGLLRWAASASKLNPLNPGQSPVTVHYRPGRTPGGPA